MTIRTRLFLAAVILVLAGCAASTDAAIQTMLAGIRRDTGADQAKLDPRFRYLRVTIHGRVALLALGFLEPHPRGEIEVWYSADREVLRLQRGRLVGATGLNVEWHNVRVPELPAWSELADRDAPLVWTRTRDVMPGYRYGVTDSLQLRRLADPPASALRGVEAGRLTWFEERMDGLPVSRYAVDKARGGNVVVYGEQCIVPDVCFTWQRWPAGS